MRVAIAGAAGRMGRTLVGIIAEDSDARLVAALERPESEFIAADVGELAGIGANGIRVTDDLRAVIDGFDVLIDFSSPEATVRNAGLCASRGLAVVIGTTGMSTAEVSELELAARGSPICMASNFSVGVTLCLKLAELAAKALGEEFDVEIIEAHHRHKVDAPSGTALSLGHAVAAALDRDLAKVAVHGREGRVGARSPSEIGFSVIRGGDIVGDHTVLFAGDGERVEISHRAGSRMAFARGAVRAARWLLGRQSGLYDMRDVLGFRD